MFERDREGFREIEIDREILREIERGIERDKD